MKQRFLAIFLILLYYVPQAQPFGGNPPSIKWKQIESPSFNVIFPEGMASHAVRVASLGERILRATAPTIGGYHRKIKIVLQNQTLVSNAYVGLAPWRSEFFLTPLSNSLQLGSLNWTDMLTLHEIRHVQQYSNFRKGLSKFAWIIAGEQGQALANSATVPDWFFEGDAVYQETLLTEQGRGRLPDFFTTYRAIDEAGLTYTYQQLRNGSFKKLLPDHYTTGYILVSEGRKQFGPEVWKNVTDRAVRFKPLFYPFQGAFKKVTGTPFHQFVKRTLYQDSVSTSFNETAITKRSDRFVTDYAFPQWVGNDSIIVYKSTSRDLPGFYWRIGDKEVKIRTADIQIDPVFSYRKGLVAFTSYSPDIRWGWRNYADIKLLNLHTGLQKKLTQNGKYFAPDISQDGFAVVAVHIDPSSKQSLHILSTNTGELLHTFSDSSLVYSYPKFSSDDRYIYSLVRQKNGWMGILQTEIGSGKDSFVLKPSKQPMAFLHVHQDKLYFTAAFHGRDKLFMFDKPRNTLFELNSRFAGVQQGVPYGKDSILYAGSSAWGSQLYLASSNLLEVQSEEWENAPLSSLGEEGPIRMDTIHTDSFLIKSYRSTATFFNFHSWRPTYELPDWSLTVYGQNILNTFQSEAYVLYNENEGFAKTGMNALFGGWFPWITIGSSYTSGRNTLVNNNRIHWDEWNLNTGIRIPLNLTKGRIYQSLNVSSLYNFQQVNYWDKPKESNIHFGYIDNQVSWSLSSQQARQHIFPRFGMATTLQHRFSISSREARQILWRANAYLPGFLKTHNLVISAAIQTRDTANQYQFSNSFPLSRGYPAVNLPRMLRLGINYHLPLLYPDFGIANLVYFSRIRANLYGDNSRVKSLRTGRVWNMNAIGTEIFFDTRWWNQQPISFGIRYSRLLSSGPYTRQPNANQFEFILPVLF
ncbi:MAG: hypothetical protein RL335_516 [Bacteroidota bacterium]